MGMFLFSGAFFQGRVSDGEKGVLLRKDVSFVEHRTSSNCCTVKCEKNADHIAQYSVVNLRGQLCSDAQLDRSVFLDSITVLNKQSPQKW